MKLYHFTGVAMLHNILAAGGISKGYFHMSDGRMLYGHSWYTSSPLPYGHGLVDGTEVLSESTKNFISRASGPNTKGPVRGTHNKRLIRLTVDSDWLKKQDTFYSMKQIMLKYGEPLLRAKILGVAGWVNIDSLSDRELMRWTKSPKLKHDTWYVHTEKLPVERILSIEFMEKTDVYVPYDFELHGGRELEKVGLYSITPQQFNELNEILQEEDFTGGEVLVICNEPDAVPRIVFRNHNGAHVLAINDGSLLQCEGEKYNQQSLKILSDWVRQHSEHLMVLWNRSRVDLLKYDS